MKLRDIILAVFIYLMPVHIIYAYSYTDDFNLGFYWRSIPVNVKNFVITDSEGELLAGLVRESINEWEESVGKDLWNIHEDYIISENYSGNYIRWSNNFAEDTGYDPSYTLAITTRYSVGPYISRTEIILNGELIYLRQNDGDILKKTILHELGHTLGLGHSEEDSIMRSYISSTNSLQEDDIYGMSQLLQETERRVSTGYISQHAYIEEESNAAKFAGCGTIQNPSGGGGGGGHGPSFLLGLIGVSFAMRRSSKENFSSVNL